MKYKSYCNHSLAPIEQSDLLRGKNVARWPPHTKSTKITMRAEHQKMRLVLHADLGEEPDSIPWSVQLLHYIWCARY